MHRSFAAFLSALVLGVGALAAAPASAVGPVGSWKCNTVSGNVYIPQQLYSTGNANVWKFKGLGWAVTCDNTLNTGDPVIATVYKFSGYHTGPNTCPNAGGPSYYGKVSVRWYFFTSAGSVLSVVSSYKNSSTPFAFSTGPCPGPFTATLNWFSGYSAPPSLTLSGTQGPPSCATIATQCASTYPTGFAGYTYSSPGYLSVP